MFKKLNTPQKISKNEYNLDIKHCSPIALLGERDHVRIT